MNLFFYSSPYKYYADNLIPIARFAEARGHNVYASYSEYRTAKVSSIRETAMTKKNKGKRPLFDFLNGNIKVDAAILTQPWWYADNSVATYCIEKGIPMYIVDHAPPMLYYTEQNGRESHQYRKNLFQSRAFFGYGKETKRVMKHRGCKEKIVSIGSPRAEELIKKVLKIKSKGMKKKGKIAVIYDTSERMESKSQSRNILKIFNFLSYHENWTFIIKEHPRSAGWFRALCKKNKNIKMAGNTKEAELLAISDLDIFTFPSSIMIFSALCGNKMFSLYGDHISEDARNFSNRYCKSIFEFKSTPFDYKQIKKNNSYKSFLKDHIELHDVPSKLRILNYIKKDLL